jgi:tetratricopeptide (TPR) repeat protein
MSRWVRSWCWAVAALVLLGPVGEAVYASDAVVLNCPAPSSQPWKKKSNNGRFTLTQRVEKGRGSVPDLYVLWLRRGATPLWQLVLKDPPVERHTWISPDGRFVLMLRHEDKLTLIGPEGREHRTWALREQLSEAELARLPTDLLCRTPRWVTDARFEGGTFVVEVPTGLLSSEDPEERRSTTVRLDLKEGKLTRQGELLRLPDEELIRAFEATQAPAARLRLADELLGRSQIKERTKGKELQAFWKRLVRAEEVAPKSLHRMAVEAIGAIGTEGEARALSRLPGTVEVRDLAVLELLIRKVPDEAGDYALRALEGHHPALSVRKRALEFLLRPGSAARDIAEEFALREQSVELRQLGLQSLVREPITEPRFQQALTFCEDAHPGAREQVTRFAMGALYSVREPERQGLIQVLRRSGEKLRMEGCPELLLLLGALMDRSGERSQAVELYARGLQALQGRPDVALLSTPELRLEAMLQLALEAEKKGERAEAERYARQVLSAPLPRTPVCAPQPSRLTGPEPPRICLPPREAAQLAREVLGRLRSRGRGASAPSAPGRAR